MENAKVATQLLSLRLYAGAKKSPTAMNNACKKTKDSI